jgi:hypothetical protein
VRRERPPSRPAGCVSGHVVDGLSASRGGLPHGGSWAASRRLCCAGGSRRPFASRSGSGVSWTSTSSAGPSPVIGGGVGPPVRGVGPYSVPSSRPTMRRVASLVARGGCPARQAAAESCCARHGSRRAGRAPARCARGGRTTLRDAGAWRRPGARTPRVAEARAPVDRPPRVTAHRRDVARPRGRLAEGRLERNWSALRTCSTASSSRGRRRRQRSVQGCSPSSTSSDRSS